MEKIKVLVNGLPLKTAWRAAQEISLDNDLELLPFSLMGSECISKNIIVGGEALTLITQEDFPLTMANEMPDIVVDFCEPEQTRKNIEFYSKTKRSFIAVIEVSDMDFVRKMLDASGVNALIFFSTEAVLEKIVSSIKFLSKKDRLVYANIFLS